MAYSEFKLALSDEELGLPALLDLCDKYRDWLRLSKEQEGGRKTRSANKKADKIYEEIMNHNLPQLKIKPLTQHHTTNGQYSNESRDVSMDSISSDTGDSSSSSRPITRSLRPRCRTPSPASSSARSAVPSTPQNQRLRARLRPQQPSGSGSSTSGSSNALVASGQHHPSVSATKIRQLLRADSAQKKRQEERERQERIRLERKVKEERAEAQKKQLLEERAITAKQKREQRLLHAAEVRKAREQAKNQRSKFEHEHQAHHHEQFHQQQQASKPMPPPPHPHPQTAAVQAQSAAPAHKPEKPQEVAQKPPEPQMKKPAEPAILNETFKKNEINNIEIVIHDTSNSVKGDAPVIATWARAPHLRKALVDQYTNPNLQPDIKATHLMPVDLERILGKSVGARHLKRTSSAVWTPPRKSIMRSNSNVSTPTR